MSANLFVFSVSVLDRRQFHVVDTATSTFDLAAGDEHNFFGQNVFLEYDDPLAYQYGQKFLGYALVVKDSNGDVLGTRGKSLFLSNIPALEKLQVGHSFTKYHSK
jgi:hypothetical protein